MGLFKCPDCEASISDRGFSCPHCGCPVNEETIAESKAKEERKLKLLRMEAKRKKTKEKLLNDVNEKLNNRCNVIRENLKKSKKYIYIPSDEIRYKTIAKILDKNKNIRPILSCFTPVDEGVLFTDSYHLFILNDSYLPFDVAFNKNYSKRKQINYLNRYKLNKIEGCYPATTSISPDERKLDSVYINLEDFLLEYYTRKKILSDKECKQLLKIQKDNNISCFDMTMTLKTQLGKIGYNAEYLKNAIDILKLDSDFYIEVYGKNRPMIIKNKDEEIALIMPINLV